MTTGSGELYVDPEGLAQLGVEYGTGADLFRAYLTQLQTIRSNYANSWGTDDLGQKFSEKFLKGLDTLESVIGSVAGTLDYTAEGLQTSGKAFRLAHEDAGDASSQLESVFDEQHLAMYQHNTPDGEEGFAQPATLEAGRRVKENDAPLASRLAERGETLVPSGERQLAATRSFSRLLRPGEEKPPEITFDERDGSDGSREQVVTIDGVQYRLTPVDTPAGDELITDDGNLRLVSTVNPETGEREYQVVSFNGQAYELDRLAPGLTTEDGTIKPATEANLGDLAEPVTTPREGVLSSAMLKRVDFAGALVDGRPLADGYELMGATVLADGNVRLDTNGYESIVPVGEGHQVTGADGQPITLDDGERLFIVKQDPNHDPYSAAYPGYEANYVDFAANGSAAPHVTDLGAPPPATHGTISSSMFSPALPPGVVSINGTPVADGYHLLGANEVEQGTVRLDTNYYHSIAPIDPGMTVTLGDGTTFTARQGQQLFLVQDAPAGQAPDGTDTTYRPNYVDFHPDGTVDPYRNNQN